MFGITANLNDFYGRVKDLFVLTKDSEAIMRMLYIESRINCNYLQSYAGKRSFKKEEIQAVFGKIDITTIKKCYETGEINTRVFSDIKDLGKLALEDDEFEENEGDKTLPELIAFLHVRITVLKMISETNAIPAKKIRYDIRINNLIKAYIQLLTIMGRHKRVLG